MRAATPSILMWSRLHATSNTSASPTGPVPLATATKAATTAATYHYAFASLATAATSTLFFHASPFRYYYAITSSSSSGRHVNNIEYHWSSRRRLDVYFRRHEYYVSGHHQYYVIYISVSVRIITPPPGRHVTPPLQYTNNYATYTPILFTRRQPWLKIAAIGRRSFNATLLPTTRYALAPPVE